MPCEVTFLRSTRSFGEVASQLEQLVIVQMATLRENESTNFSKNLNLFDLNSICSLILSHMRVHPCKYTELKFIFSKQIKNI